MTIAPTTMSPTASVVTTIATVAFDVAHTTTTTKLAWFKFGYDSEFVH